MNFDSLLFFLFLAAVLALHGVARNARARKGVLLGSSYLFYGFWNPPFVLLLAFSTAVDWFAARGIHQRRRAGRPARWLLVVSLATNLGLLAYFKYSGFVLASLSDALGAVGIDWTAPAWQVILPVGISFYTFQSISYTIDVWRGEREPADDWLDFALYVSFFAQLVAGPIVRAGELLPQLQQRTRTVLAEVPMAAWLIVFGLFLKVVLADSVFAPASDAAFARGAEAGFWLAWSGAFAFAGQIYCDFCGYSTIAIGVARLFGLRLPDNFRAPYAALGFRDFWRRWHITLSRWLRDYLYVPLGGNRAGRARTLRNLAITMLLGGLWHGASWNFALWGALHGGYLVAEHLVRGRDWARAPSVLRWPATWALTFLAVCIAWIPFRAPDWSVTAAMWADMARPAAWSGLDGLQGFALAGLGLLLLGQWAFRGQRVQDFWRRRDPLWLAVSAGLMLAAVLLAPTPGRPFIYFQF